MIFLSNPPLYNTSSPFLNSLGVYSKLSTLFLKCPQTRCSSFALNYNLHHFWLSSTFVGQCFMDAVRIFYVRNCGNVQNLNVLNANPSRSAKHCRSLTSIHNITPLNLKPKVGTLLPQFSRVGIKRLPLFYHRFFTPLYTLFKAQTFGLFFPYTFLVNEALHFNSKFSYQASLNRRYANKGFAINKRLVFLHYIITRLGFIRVKSDLTTPYNPYRKYFKLTDPISKSFLGRWRRGIPKQLSFLMNLKVSLPQSKLSPYLPVKTQLLTFFYKFFLKRFSRSPSRVVKSTDTFSRWKFRKKFINFHQFSQTFWSKRFVKGLPLLHPKEPTIHTLPLSARNLIAQIPNYRRLFYKWFDVGGAINLKKSPIRLYRFTHPTFKGYRVGGSTHPSAARGGCWLLPKSKLFLTYPHLGGVWCKFLYHNLVSRGVWRSYGPNPQCFWSLKTHSVIELHVNTPYTLYNLLSIVVRRSTGATTPTFFKLSPKLFKDLVNIFYRPSSNDKVLTSFVSPASPLTPPTPSTYLISGDNSVSVQLVNVYWSPTPPQQLLPDTSVSISEGADLNRLVIGSLCSTTFVFSNIGFLFLMTPVKTTSTILYNNFSQVKARFHKNRLSFFYKNDIKKNLLNKPNLLKTLFSFQSNDTMLDADFTPASLFHVEGGSPSASKGSLSNHYFQNSFDYQRVSENYSNRELDHSLDNDWAITRIRFKPGYQRIWRRAREALNYTNLYNYRYQVGLTKRITRLRRIRYLHYLKVVELSLNRVLVNARLVLDLQLSKLLVSSNSVFLNGFLATNPTIRVFANDFVQLIINIRYYIVYRWLVNWNSYSSTRFSKLLNFKNNSSRVDLSKQVSRNLPDWVFNAAYKRVDIPKYFEVDYFTLSVFVLYEPLFITDYNPLTHLISRPEIYSLYNWKYIN